MPTLDMQPLFDSLWDFTDPAGSEARFRAALGDAQARTDAASTLELRTQVARALGLQHRFNEAHTALDDVQEEMSSDSHAGALVAVNVRLLLERGRLLNSDNQRERAAPFFEQALNEAREAQLDVLAIDAAHMMAIAGPPGQALDWNLRALDMSERSAIPRARQWRGSLHNNIGWTLHDCGEFAQALLHFEKALACRIEQGKAEDIRIARWCIARCLRSLERIDEALAMQQQLAREIAAAGAGEDGYVSQELGECLLALGRGDEAQPHLVMAHRLLSKNPPGGAGG